MGRLIGKLLPFLFIGFLFASILSALSQLLPLILYSLGFAIVICCIYGLLPPGLRLAPVEAWLNNDNSVLNSKNKKQFTSSTSTQRQPELDFNKLFGKEEKLPNREEFTNKIKSRVIGQDEAIDQLVRVVFGKLAAQESIKPLTIFLPGTTGTGKTELSKALAEALETNLIRFDMGEFADKEKSSNLFGSSKGYLGSEDGGGLPNAIRQSKGKCVILFDEVEKAHQSLWRQLLAFYDEGRIKDTLGQCKAPKNTICILTSNIEAEKIANNPNEAKEIIKNCGFFPPEFIGRIDKVIPLLRLNFSATAKLSSILAKRLAQRYGINLIVEQQGLQQLMLEVAEEAERYGGRGITEKISDLILDDLIDLQAERVTQARLTARKDRISVEPLSKS